MSLLAIRDLCVDAPGARLVENVSFALAPGERLGVIGESGSGKSLTATSIIGLLPKSLRASGSVRLAGTEVIGAREGDLRALRGSVAATVFQEPLTALDPLMRVGHQIGEVAVRAMRRAGEGASKAKVRAAVFDLMAKVALPDAERIARAFPFEISGGQRQRVAIAMALACRPKLLIADEPTTALDVTTQAEVLLLLDRLVRENGMALLFITHDLTVVASIAERVLVMQSGRVVEAGPLRQVFASPHHDYTRRLLEAAANIERALVPS